MTTAQDSQKSVTPEIFEFFIVVTDSATYYLCNKFNSLNETPLYNGVLYTVVPIQGSGWSKTTSGSAPRPTLNISLRNPTLRAAIASMGDFVGFNITRLRVYEKYMDAANFAGGVNPDESPDEILSVDQYVINSKQSETKDQITFELCWSLDFSGQKLPAWVALRDVDFPGLGIN